MSARTLHVKHTVTRHGAPLAVVSDLPGEGAELTPAQLRQLAAALLTAADECEILHDSTRRQIPVCREYPLASLPFSGRIDSGQHHE
jgi:hypothetical protein